MTLKLNVGRHCLEASTADGNTQTHRHEVNADTCIHTHTCLENKKNKTTKHSVGGRAALVYCCVIRLQFTMTHHPTHAHPSSADSTGRRTGSSTKTGPRYLFQFLFGAAAAARPRLHHHHRRTMRAVQASLGFAGNLI